MNVEWVQGQTRWEAAVESVQTLLTVNNGYFDDNVHVALMRFSHDPDPSRPGTPIPGDTSGLLDGTRLDVPWVDPEGAYLECNGGAVLQALNALAPPPGSGGTWTNGAMLRAQQVVEQARAEHPEDLQPESARAYGILLYTQGVWCSYPGAGAQESCVDMTPELAGGDDDPGPTIAELYQDHDVPTYVVALGDAPGTEIADQLANAGGTTTALTPALVVPALQAFVDEIVQAIETPTCIESHPRVMLLLDASSSMLNVGGTHGAQGETRWDRVRDALAHDNGVFRRSIDVGATVFGAQPRVEEVVHIGAIAYGSLDEQTLLVDYGRCTTDNVAWALDPNTSCAAGCGDPWGGPPITWTFVSSPPVASPYGYPFAQETSSHMPACEQQGDDLRCTGSMRQPHLALALAASSVESYRNDPPHAIDEDTIFANILVTGGASDSTYPQVQNALVDLHENHGVITYVVGFGDAPPAELENMACWGSGGSGDYPGCTGGSVAHLQAQSQQELEDALHTILEGLPLAFGPCCPLLDCYSEGPGGEDPDPRPPEEGSTTEPGEGTSADDESSGDSGTSPAEVTSGAPESDTGTRPAEDTESDTVGPQTEGEFPSGHSTDSSCSCTVRPGPGGGMLVLLGLLVPMLRRRRR